MSNRKYNENEHENNNPESGSASANPTEKSLTISQDKIYTIGDLAREFKVTLRAIRFYEDRNLLNPRRDGTIRFYNHEQKNRLNIILKAKKLGFTLTEIQSLLEKKPKNSTDLTLDIHQIEAQLLHLNEQKNEIDEAIQHLEEYKRKLTSTK